jgi:predicted metallo-beta-lactamase superfamily hydrolase
MICICDGSNDFNNDSISVFNSDTNGPNINNIIEFMQSNKHTNVILANVPLRYDLSYYSHRNERIRAYNRRIGEIIQEHEKMTLMELNTERKNHTRHGLHFNKRGKRWLSNKITKLIYAILDVKTEPSKEM